MRRFVSIILIFLFLNKASGQEKHFVFIQSDNKQPFYVSVNGKIYSSSSSGYVIIPKLADGNYNVTVGFAQNAAPEQSFPLSINKKDLGYNLKNFGEKGFGLFNLQTLEVTMAAAGSSVGQRATAGGNIGDDIISFPQRKKDTAVARADTKLAKKKSVTPPAVKTEEASASKDTSAASVDVGAGLLGGSESLHKDVPVSGAAVAETTQVAKDSAVVKSNPPIDTISTNNGGNKQETATAAPSTLAITDVKKVSEQKSDEGLFLAFVDSNGKKTDTVQVIIPATKSATASSVATAAAETTTSAATAQAIAKPTAEPEIKKDEPKFLDVNMGASKKDSATAVPKQETVVTIMPNSNCKEIASDEDYGRLRKKMAQETTDEKMIGEAKKYYRDKCFTTAQIKRLSTLFLSDEGRLNFFNASFLSVADATQYPTLETEFVDPAFVTRFKALFQ